MSPSPTTFERRCANCIDINLDDSMLDGHSALTPDGRSYVEFDLGKAEMPKYQWKRSCTLHLDTYIEDNFPGLPFLSTSIDSGCDFCAFLKDILTCREVSSLFEDLAPGFADIGELPFRLSFSFRWEHSTDRPPQDGEESFRDLKLTYLVVAVHFDETKMQQVTLYPGEPCELACRIRPFHGKGTSEFTSIAFKTYRSLDGPSDDVATWLRLEAPYVPEPLSAESLAWCRQELHDCYHGISGHDTCATPEQSDYLPTRLIDVRDAHLRIVSGKLISQHHHAGQSLPRYAALSYCWGNVAGDATNYQTTSRNHVDRQASLDPVCLPPVLQDAVAMTRALSLPYLWIDALCILQGDRDDWERESAQLHMTYSRAYVTIACLTSSCQLGFLKPWNPQTQMRFRSKIDPSISGAYGIQFANCYRDGLARDYYLDQFPPSRWFSRGWTCQENWLSSRVLFVGLDFMAVHCTAGLHTNGQRYPDETHSRKATLFGNPWIRQNWTEIVSLYADRYLTVAEDTLPAMSGIASVFSNFMGDGYLAGVWKSDILRGVLWSYARFAKPQVRSLGKLLESLDKPPETYIAPSWSWAGHRYIQFYFDAINIDLIFSCHATGSTTVRGKNPFGKVAKGHLLLTGHTWDIGPYTKTIKTSAGSIFTLGNNVEVICRLDWTTEGQVLRGNFKLILLASYCNVASVEGESKRVMQSFGLILHKWKSTRSYVRVGAFESQGRDGSIEVFFRQLAIEKVRVI